MKSVLTGNSDITSHVPMHIWKFKTIAKDALLVKFVDLIESNEIVSKGGIIEKINHDQSRDTWRVGEVVLAGTDIKEAKKGDLVMFENLRTANVRSDDDDQYVILHEDIIVGIVEKKAEE